MEGDELRKIVKFVEDFAEIGRYFDLPVKTYSSGMKSRVGFGLSLAFDFDYFLIDEAMSTGDAHFQNKAQKAFKDRISGSKVILVTHSMAQVRKMCDYVLLLRDGQVFPYEDVEEGIHAYEHVNQAIVASDIAERRQKEISLNRAVLSSPVIVRKWRKFRRKPYQFFDDSKVKVLRPLRCFFSDSR